MVLQDRRAILELLFTGLRRLEYRGYDSAGISVDSDQLVELLNAAAASEAEAAAPAPAEAAAPAAPRHASYDGSLPLTPNSALNGAPVADGAYASVHGAGLGGLLPVLLPSAPVATGGAELAATPHGRPPRQVSSISNTSAPRAKVPLVIKKEGKVDALVEAAYAELSAGTSAICRGLWGKRVGNEESRSCLYSCFDFLEASSPDELNQIFFTQKEDDAHQILLLNPEPAFACTEFEFGV